MENNDCYVAWILIEHKSNCFDHFLPFHCSEMDLGCGICQRNILNLDSELQPENQVRLRFLDINIQLLNDIKLRPSYKKYAQNSYRNFTEV